MRRGHPGNSGWRNENQRHFGPRGGGGPHFRPPRTYGPPEPPRFPPSGPRFRGPFTPPPGHLDNRRMMDNPERNTYRGAGHHNKPRPPDRGGHSRQRQILPYMQQMRHKDNEHPNFNKPPMYEDDNPFSVNNMGDVDLRKPPPALPKRDTYSQRPITTWMNPTFENNRPYYNDNRSPQKNVRNENEREPMHNFTGHRPPSSDHYNAPPCPSNNDTPFARSLDDTVDIIRKRLLNRDSQSHHESSNEPKIMDQDMRIDSTMEPQEPPIKKKRPRQNNNIKSNCNQMKNKIVHQLFKMDKDKMHKLMDNPSSSTKFEYAISSLITESQNSLNRHLRSVAEKSLCSSSSDFIHNDNNTIYEDTFMKQMQGILDPQDTVLLEDIKPLVLAELSKVLQLDEMEIYDVEDYGNMYSHDNSQYRIYNDLPAMDQYSENMYYNNQEVPHSSNNIELTKGDFDSSSYEYNEPQPSYNETKPLFERRPAKRASFVEERQRSTESRHSRKSVDKPTEDKTRTNDEHLPLFDTNMDQISDDDDPFAELDNQYHVAVDVNYIENEDVTPDLGQQMSPTSDPDIHQQMSLIHDKNNTSHNNDSRSTQNRSKSPVKLFSVFNKTVSETNKKTTTHIEIKKEIITTPIKDTHMDHPVPESIRIKEENIPRVYDSEKENPVNNKPTDKLAAQSNTRKRSIDQLPSHRKEKRKKSSFSESHEPSNSTISLSPKHIHKDTPKVKKADADKTYSEKYVKRKDSHRKSKDSEVSKTDTPKKPSSSSHTIMSPKDSSSNTNIGTPTSSKVKLTTIDMFCGQPKKTPVTHQAHRNTANAAQTPTVKSPEENKPKPIVPTAQTSFARKLAKRHVGTQVIKKYRDRDCQTESKATTTTASQTDPVSFGKSKSNIKSRDPFERMKEIDLEIQVLLQEKFKLYNSLESRDSNSTNSMETLGMTVLNVPIDTDQSEKTTEEILDEDAIVENFTNIPEDELAEIAIETVQSNRNTPRVGTRNRRQKVLDITPRSSQSPTTKRQTRKTKPPNISLLEQIITDDRPIEDIISLDDLESAPPPSRTKRKPQKSTHKKKSSKKRKVSKSSATSSRSLEIPQPYNMKACSVILIKTDIENYLTSRSECSSMGGESQSAETVSSERISPDPTLTEESVVEVPLETEEPVTILEDTIENDIHFDMLDVSEDIVIGDHCEVKTDKEGGCNERVHISEEIILDNSQSSMEDAMAEAGATDANECKTYDYLSDENLMRESTCVVGHADAVLALECIDNGFIAACLDGNVYHFSMSGRLVATLHGSNLAVTCLTVVKEKHGTTIYTGSLDSRIRYYCLETGMEKGPECNVLSPIQTMDRAWDTVFVGTRTGFVLQFECKNNMLIPVSTVKFSEQAILALRAMKEGPRKVLLVAARFEDVTIKDAQTGLLLRTLTGPKMTVYSLLFEDGKVYCGTSSNLIHVYDYSSGTHMGVHECGKGAVCLRAAGALIFAGCYDGCVYVHREGDARPLAQLRGPAKMMLALAIDGNKIVAGYKDRSMYIWKLPLAILQEMIL